MTRVLVTDGEQRSSLAVVRSLGSGGHQVAVCSSEPRPIAGASRYCSHVFPVPGPRSGPGEYAAAVVGAAKAFGARVLIPMTDRSAPQILRESHLSAEVAVPFPGLTAYERISDKAYLMQVAGTLGIPVPEQHVLSSPSDLSDLLDGAQLNYPVVLKPARSAVDTDSGVLRVGVVMAKNSRELQQGLAGFPGTAYPILMQRKVTGPGLGVFLLAWDGRTVASFAHRRLREKPPTGGVSVYRESVPVRTDLLEHSEKLLEHFQWRGVAMVEFKEDRETGRAYLMEVNARFWGSLQLAIDSGVDFPMLLMDCLEGKDPAPVRDYRSGVRSRWFWGDVDHLIGVVRASRATRQAFPDLPGRLHAVARFCVPWRVGDRFEVMRWRDPRPFLVESANWLSALWSR